MRRRRVRECALKMLYEADVRGEALDSLLDGFWEIVPETPEDERRMAEDLAREVEAHRNLLDEKISSAALNWKIDRMGYVDRNILRIGAYEIIFRPDIPPAVSINEAIEIAKNYGTQDSPKFINGILNRIKEITPTTQPSP